MQFPDSPRVIYERNPLVEVVCQLRFPRVLVLEERVPAEFHQFVSKRLPVVEVRHSLPVTLGIAGHGQEISPGKAIYDFQSRDRKYKLSLSSDFIALSTTKYTRWEEFSAHLFEALEAFHNIYAPIYYSRVGLRYQDKIIKRDLGLTDKPWAQLVAHWCLGPLGSNDIDPHSVLNLQNFFQLRLPNGRVSVRISFSQEGGEEDSMIIDNDFYEEGVIEYGTHIQELLQDYNSSARRAFRWIISDFVHDALGPQRV